MNRPKLPKPNNTTRPQLLLSRRDVAAMMGTSTETVKRRERDGTLKAIKFNARLTRYRREDVETMIAQASAR